MGHFVLSIEKDIAIFVRVTDLSDEPTGYPLDFGTAGQWPKMRQQALVWLDGLLADGHEVDVVGLEDPGSLFRQWGE